MRRSIALVASSLVLLSACGQAEVSTDTLEKQVSTQLEAQVGQAPDSVTCKDPLPAKVGEKVRCELSADDTRIGLTVEATEVDGDNVKFDISVDDKPIE